MNNVIAALMLVPVLAPANTIDEVMARQQAAVDAYSSGRYADAFELFQDLAQEGNKAGQHNLGLMLALGQGTPTDLVESVAWLGVAAEYDDESSTLLRESLLRRLDEHQLAQANERSRELIQQYGGDAVSRRLERRNSRRVERNRAMEERFAAGRGGHIRDVKRAVGHGSPCGSAREADQVACYQLHGMTGMAVAYADRNKVFTTLSNEGFTRTSVPRFEIPPTEIILRDFRLLPVGDDDEQAVESGEEP